MGEPECVVLRNLFMLPDCEGQGPRTYNVPGHQQGAFAVSNTLSSYYTGCTRVRQNLVISGLNDSITNTSYFNHIEEVLGTVIILSNAVTQISLPKLAIIRGQILTTPRRLSEANYSLIVQDNPNLQHLRLPKFHSIQRGNAYIENNAKLCWPSKVPWLDITANKGGAVLRSNSQQQCKEKRMLFMHARVSHIHVRACAHTNTHTHTHTHTHMTRWAHSSQCLDYSGLMRTKKICSPFCSK